MVLYVIDDDDGEVPLTYLPVKYEATASRNSLAYNPCKPWLLLFSHTVFVQIKQIRYNVLISVLKRLC